MKIASAYSLFIASLCAVPSAHAAVRGRSLVRGVTARSNNRMLQEEASGDGPESKGGKKESPIAPKKRDCKLRQEGENEVTFKCKTKSDDAEAKVKDEIDYTVETSEKGVMVKIKYEQEIKVEDGEKGSKGGKADKGAGPEGEEPEEEPPMEGELAEPPSDEEIAEPPADEEIAEPPVDEGNVDPVDEATTEPSGEAETLEPSATEPPTDEQSPQAQRALQEQETKTQFEVIYDSIIEYEKGENSTTGEAYDWENDVVLQTISLNTWNVMSEIASDNQTSSFSATSPDESITFTFTLNQAADGESASANKMKIDFELKGFPWTSDDSFVALLSTVETERKVDVKMGKGPQAEAKMGPKDVFISFDDVANTTSFTPFGEYSWAETAEATSSADSSNQENTTTIESQGNETMASRSANITQTITVVATSPVVQRADRRAQEGKQIESIAYSFVGGDAAHRASIIYWDPSAGVDYVSSARPMSLVMAGAGVVFALLALI